MFVDEMPTRGGKFRAHAVEMIGGGMAANAAVAVARLGGDASLIARLGDDGIGGQIIQDLKNSNVNCELVRQFPHIRSSFSSVYIDQEGERQVVNFRDPELSSSTEWFTGALPEFDVILTDPRWPEGAFAAMYAAKEALKPGILDAETPLLESKDALQLASHIAFSADGLRDYAATDDLSHALEIAESHLEGFLAVTDGSAGVYWRDGGETKHTPAFEIKPVDTLGAGDVWHGAFALAIGEKMPVSHAIRFACAAAAIKCTHPGGRTGAPTRSEVDQFLRTA